METTTPPIPTEKSYLPILIVSILMGIIITGVYQFTKISEVINNWEKYRCDLSVMPFAGFYGKDVEENFNFCMTGMLTSKAKTFTSPFATIIATIMGAMMTFMESLNSFRVMLGTLTGGVRKVFQEFSDRFNFLYNNIRTTSTRMQFLFQRLISTFISIIFLGSSAVTAGMNFGDTFLFKFLDTFCFDPETSITIRDVGRIPVKYVKLGSMLSDGSKITSVYRFYSRGVPMVRFNGSEGPIIVSTNHYMKDIHDTWIRCEDHVNATAIGDWESDRPLVCFDTDTHRIPIGGYVFSDYDETNATDEATMRLVDGILNGSDYATEPYSWPYMPCVEPTTAVKLKDGSTKPVRECFIGDELETGVIIGLVARTVDKICVYEGVRMTPSTLVWVAAEQRWIRVGHMCPVVQESQPMYMPLVMSTSTIPIVSAHGKELMVRDFMELLSHDIEGPTEEAMLSNK
jgi:hypothetical protein